MIRYKRVEGKVPSSTKVLEDTFDHSKKTAEGYSEPFLSGSAFSNYDWVLKCSSKYCSGSVQSQKGWKKLACDDFSGKRVVGCKDGVLKYRVFH